MKEWVDFVPLDFRHESGVSLDLGCGSRPRNPTRAKRIIGIDVVQPKELSARVEFLRTRMGEGLPLENESIDVITAFDFLEHLPRTAPTPGGALRNLFIDEMNEIHRVLKKGGLLIAVTPGAPLDAAFADPTHVNPITMETVNYFSGPTYARELEYGFQGAFDALECCWLPWSSPLYSRDANGEPTVTLDDARRRARLWRRAARRALAVSGLRKPLPPVHILWVLKRR